MTLSTAFQWHDDARLFAGANQFARPAVDGTKQFQHILAHPTLDALPALGGALVNQCSFCVSDGPLPDGILANAGHFLTLTGGSSGQPKVIQRSHASWVASFKINATRFSLSPDDSVAVFGRLSHSLALYGVLEALYLGLNAHTLDDLLPRTQRNLIAQHGVTILYATPTQLRMLAQQAASITLPKVRLILCGGGMLDQNTQQMAKDLCPNAELHVFYGSAETSFITLAGHNTPIGSVGRAYPGATVQIRDAIGERTNAVGEVWVQSPYLFERYLSGDSPDTRRHNGFVTVGEMGQMDAAGNLWLKGRKTRMVTIADQNIFPEVVEALVAGTSEFRPCAAIPVPDQIRGYRLILVLQGEQDNKIAQSVKNTCRTKLGVLMTPHKILFHPSLPLLSSGKPDLVAISAWIENQQ